MVEDHDERRGEQRDQPPDEQRIAEAQLGHEPDGPPHPGHVAGAVIVADDRRGAVGEGHDGGLGDLPHRVDDGHDTDVKVAAEGAQGGVAGHLHQAVGKGHDKAGSAQGDDAPDAGPVGVKAPDLQPQLGFGAGQEPQHPHRRKPLGEHGGNGRAPHAQPAGIDEDGVQHDVGGGAQQYREHADTGKALAVDVGVQPQGGHDKDGAQQINGQVIGGIAVGFVAGAEEVEHRFVEHQPHHRERHAADHQHKPGVGHDLGGGLFILLAPGDGAQRRTAHPEQVGEGRDQRDQREAQPQPRQGQGALAGDFADVDAVHNVIQKVEHLRHQHGCRHRQNAPAHIAGGKIHLAPAMAGG